MLSRTQTARDMIMLPTVKQQLGPTTMETMDQHNVAALIRTESLTILADMIAVTTLSCLILANAESSRKPLINAV